ncbi:hypothetical protein KAR91_09140 [Candidatus Pacearchaeota archaeon]|nr:hypothetical protein [Candidatus Pacearchaeota archaeon]
MSEPTGQSKKISQLNGATTLSDGDLIAIVDSTGNRTKKITFAEFKTALGVLGTIASQGDPAGTPVLDQVLTASGIRILEDGSGVKASVSAQDGITLEHNFIEDTTGAEIVVDLAVLQPKFRSIVGVLGVNVAEDGDRIQISLGTPVTTKTVVITQESDLPTPVGGRHPMADDTDYLFTNDLDTGTDGFLMGNNTVVRAADSSIVMLTYTGTNPMFQSVSNSNKITMIRLDCPNADLFDLSGATDYIFQFVNCSVTSCDSIGTIADVLAMQINDVSFEDNVTDGLLFTGTNGVFIAQNNLVVQNATGTAFDLGTSVFSGFSMSNNFATLAAGATFINGAASSANMATGALGTIINSKNLSNVGIMLSGITVNDARWEFALNEDIPDTRPDGLLSMQGNATDTVIAVAGTPVLVAGTWVVNSTSQMTGTTAGRLTYDGEKDAKLPITSSITAEPASGGAVSISAYIAVDGVVDTDSKRSASASSGSPASITIPWQETFANASFVEVFVANDTTTVDVLVSSAIHRVN